MSILNRNTISFLALVAFLLSVSASGQVANISPSLKSIQQSGLSSDSLISIVIFLDNDGLSQRISKISSLKSLAVKEKHEQVIENLVRISDSSLANIKMEISQIYPPAKFREFWIAQAVATKIPISILSEIQKLLGVYSIIEDARIEYIQPVETPNHPAKAQASSNHLGALNIPALWKRGLRGRGRIVCSFDTGVEETHPALQSKWRGNHADHSAAWFAPNLTEPLPVDKVGHGTHTMGIMVGSAPDDSFGVAPDAEWISAAVVDQGQTLNRTVSDILAAFQWAVDPDGNPATIDDMPDVILNSWGIPGTALPPCDETFNHVIDNVEAAGIVTIFAAGNEGPAPMSLRLPAVRATSPLNTFAIGAIDDATDIIAPFSSRGPSSCDTSAKKPEVVAPGIQITSSYKDGAYRTLSGTSMAAPFIAGMAALLRQYNPNTTVDEIKNAIILSSRDLGDPGEDNDYGYGLPDAEKAVQYLPVPSRPEVYVDAQITGGDGIADPGETIDLFVRLNIPSMVFDSLTGSIISADSKAKILSDRTVFVFERGSAYSMNISPFVISIDRNMINGVSIPLNLVLQFPYEQGFDTLSLNLAVGRIPNGNMITHATSELKLTVSDFGQFGMGANSIYPAGGEGFKFEGSENLLYEAGIIVGRSPLQLSSSVRDSLGRADQSDFTPLNPLSTSYPDNGGGFLSHSKFFDTRSTIPIPITIDQTVITYDKMDEDGFVIVKYSLINESNENLTNLYFGFLTDFDLSANGDEAGLIWNDELFYQAGDSIAIGILSLSSPSGIITLDNGPDKNTLTDQQKFNYISHHGAEINDSLPADLMVIHSFGPFNISPYDSAKVDLALIVGKDISSLTASASKALAKYLGSTDVDENYATLPTNFELYQNFPNPFNPVTTIMYDLPKAGKISISIYNILGQEICALYDDMASAGRNIVAWNGLDSFGEPVASGLYLYRLKSESTSMTKKMILLK